MTAPRVDRSIAAHDPDLAQTIEDMVGTVHRLKLAEEDLVRLRRAEMTEGVPAALAKVNAIKDTIAARSARLVLGAASGLRLIVEEHERFRRKAGRRPNMEQLTEGVRVAADLLCRHALTACAAEAEAAHLARAARHMAASSANAVEYLEASA